jgi:hypothetical protein
LLIFKGIHECFAFLQQKKVSKKCLPAGRQAAADEKIAKNQSIPLKENNSLASSELKQIFFLNVPWLDFLNAFFQRRKPQDWTLPCKNINNSILNVQ